MDLFTSKRKRADTGESPDSELDLSSVKKPKSRTYGLEVLHQPEDESKGTYDIVFVHGLGGSIQTTWLDEKSEAHWPKDFVPQDLPNFRVFAFGYDADIVNMWNPASKSRITNHAQDLLGALAGERNLTDTTERMIIFVGHSLGGLIIQQALCASKDAVEDYMQTVLEHTYAVAFLGTPHLGADLAKWAAFGSQVINVFTCSNPDLVHVLRSGSEMLAHIQESFQKNLRLRESKGRPIQITCFYEQLPLRVTGDLVVSMQSAVLSAYPSYGIHANHMNMVKFKTRNDDGYQTILKSLLIWRKEMSRLASVQTSRRSFSAEDENLVEMLYTCDYESRKMQVPPALAGTCQWLQQNQKYTQWKTESTPCALWMIADPGCGKSVLVSYLIDQLQKEHTAASSVCYFFFSDSNGERNDGSSMMCCILHQLFTTHPHLFRYAKSELRTKGRRITEQFATMWKIFSRVVMDPECPDLYCLIDALDECECDSRRQLIRSFSTLFEHQSSSSAGRARLRLFVTSRAIEFLGPMSLDPNYVTLSGDEVMKPINNDIAQLIRARVDALTQRRRLSKYVHHQLTWRLRKDADQTFLWVALVLDMLENSANASEEALEAVTRDLPRDLDGVYTKLLSQTSDVEMARKILHMVVAAFRPLTLQEINIALALRPDDSSIVDVKRRLDPSIEYALRKICGPIIRITDSRVTLVHLTAKSFLIQRPLHLLSAANLREQPLAPVDSHTILANLCTQYLLLEEILDDQILDTIYQSDSGGDHENQCGSTTSEIIRKGDTCEERLELIVDSYCKRYGFLDYSAKYWTQHYRLGERKGLTSRAERLCVQYGRSSYYTWFYVYATSSSMWGYKYMSLEELMVASYFGLEELAIRLITRRALINETDDNGWTALMYAAWSGSEKIVSVLLDYGADVNATGEMHNSLFRRDYTALLAAATNGHPEIVQLLRYHGAEANTKTELALSTAAAEGHRNVVATLLEGGCDIEERNAFGQVPLHHACLNGRADVFRFLVSQDADFSAKDRFGRNALDMAAESGSVEIVRWLLSKRADVNATDCFGTTAFDLAHWFGHYQVLRILVDAGANDPCGGSIDDYSQLEPEQEEASYNSRLHRLSGRSSMGGMDVLIYFPWFAQHTFFRLDGNGISDKNPNWKEEGTAKVEEMMNKIVAQLKRLD